jgi:glycine cleavage system regulatory protein
MASIIRIKRSTGTIAPASLNFGELGLTVGVGTHGNGGGRLFVGNSVSDATVVGGRYYTDLLSIAPGLVAGQTNPTTAGNGFVAILDANRKVDQWNVDNLRLDGNTFSSTDTDGDINLDPNGTGEIVIPDDTFLTFGTSKDAKIEYDENGLDKIQVTGADWNYNDGVAISISDTTASTTPTTGALTVTGGVGFATHLNVGGNVDIDLDLNVDGGDITTNLTAFNLLNANATRVNFAGAATNLVIGATSGIATIRNATLDLDGDLNVDGGDVTSNTASLNLFNSTVTTANVLGAGTGIVIGATTGITTIRNATLDLDGDLNVDGGDVTSNTASLNLFNSTVTTANVLGAATNLVVGATTGITTIRNATLDLDGDLNVDGGDVTSNTASLNLFNSTVTTANVLGAATNLVVGAATGITTIRNATLDLDGDLNVDGGDITTNLTAFNLLNATVTTANVLGAATNLVVGATTGIATIRNTTLSVPNATTLNLGSTSSVTSVTFPSTPNTSFVSIAATTNATTTTSGALRVAGGVGIVKDVHIGGTLNVTGAQSGLNLTLTGNLEVQGNTTLGNASTDLTTITGIVTHTGSFTNIGGVTIDNVGISSNVISTKPGGGNVLYIDPYPDGLSNEGLVVVKGSLQVDGTTTTVDSSSVTVNGAIISLGDVTSNRTVVSAVSSGVSTISLDSIVGINTGDIISGSTSLPNSGVTTVTAYNSSTKIITIQGSTSSGITSTTQLTVTHAYDTNTDRGISFDYNTGVGTANHKSGFFGFDDSSIASSSSTVDNHGTHANDSRKWTYVPDATIANSTVSGTKGFLDVKGIYYQSGDFALGGAVYFDSQGLQRSTNAVASPTITSKQILTAVTEVNLTVTAVSVTEGDLISQVTSGAYGVVKTTSSGTTITVIGVEGTFNTTNNLLINGTSISRIPSAATTIYTNKPTWTSTLDGGTF